MRSFALSLALALCGCPARLPPVTNCTPYTQSCINNRPHVCSGDRRQEPSGDLPCSSVAVGAVCVVLPDGRAGCRLSDAGVAADATDGAL